MQKWRQPLSLLAIFVSTLIGACGNMPSIATNVEYCCSPSMLDLKTFRVEFEAMPEFLKPMLRDEAAIVLDGKGLEYTEGDAQAILKMTYVHNPLPEDSLEKPLDSLGESSAPGITTRFMAEVKIEMRDAVSQELIWSGMMVRAHHVQMGAYMHDQPARAAMRDAFATLFAEYPAAGDFPDGN
jgi:hypothetical protein